MRKEINNADTPVHPHYREEDGLGGVGEYGGLTKREYFAGLAMQSLIQASMATVTGAIAFKDVCEGNPTGFIANKAIGFADELLKALETK